MSDVRTHWYMRPWGMVVLAMALPIVAYLVYILFLVATYAYQFHARGVQTVLTDMGRNPAQTSVSRLFAAKSVATIDKTRIEPAVFGPTRGNPKARVRVVEFLDYGCPYCRRLEPVIQAYMKAHPDDIYLILRDLPITELHPQAEAAAIAAQCIWQQGDPERFWRYHDILFATQDHQDDAALRQDAVDVGADLNSYDACVLLKRPLDEINVSIDDAIELGAQGTPTLFFNGVPIAGAMDDATFSFIVQEAMRVSK